MLCLYCEYSSRFEELLKDCIANYLCRSSRFNWFYKKSSMASLFGSYSITRESTYLSDIAVHLFLQTPLSVKEIEEKMNGTDSGGELLEELQSPSILRGCALSRSCSAADELNFDHDSGFSYSTASSLNDCCKYFSPFFILFIHILFSKTFLKL